VRECLREWLERERKWEGRGTYDAVVLVDHYGVETCSLEPGKVNMRYACG
jgi:hypothetical protein